jgi:hypothetical protein
MDAFLPDGFPKDKEIDPAWIADNEYFPEVRFTNGAVEVIEPWQFSSVGSDGTANRTQVSL